MTEEGNKKSRMDLIHEYSQTALDGLSCFDERLSAEAKNGAPIDAAADLRELVGICCVQQILIDLLTAEMKERATASKDDIIAAIREAQRGDYRAARRPGSYGGLGANTSIR